MPVVNLQITRGATRAQKAAVVAEFTDTLVRHLGKRPEHIHIVIQEVADEDWGYDGLLTDAWRQRETASAQKSVQTPPAGDS